MLEIEILRIQRYLEYRDNQDYVRDREITGKTEITKIMLETER